MTDLKCAKEKVFQTFPINFLLLFFIFGFGSCFLGCIFVPKISTIKFVPLFMAVGFETALALAVGAMKSEHTEELLTQLYDTFDCYKRGEGMMTQLHDNLIKYDFKSMDDVQTQFNCCGVNYYEEWLDAFSLIPYSCCANLDNCSLFGLKEKPGCFVAMKKDVYSNWNAMIMFIIIFVFIKLVIAAMYVCNAITYHNEKQFNPKMEQLDTAHVTE